VSAQLTPHGFDHYMCGGCWISERSAQMPYTLGFDNPLPCCWCGRLTSSGIIHWSVFAPACGENAR
jgi:hypothetical protein